MSVTEVKQKIIKPEKLRELIESTHGQPFHVSFIKKDGSVREMNAQTEVAIDLKGGKSTLEDHPEYYVVYDMDKEGYRAVNLTTTFRLQIGDTVYIVEKEKPKDEQGD